MDNKSKKQITNDYRKAKKINKSKIRDGKRQKEFLLDETSILNALPSGAFDKKSPKKEEDAEDSKDDITQDNNSKLEFKNKANLKIIEDEDDEYEKFDDDYFKQETI
jgi:hypothetical protein